MTCDVAWALAWMASARQVIADNRELLIDLDRQIGDGDHGENMDRGFAAVVDALAGQQCATVADVLKSVAKTLMSTVGGAAGPLYGTAFLRAAKAAPSAELSSAEVVALIAGALEGIQARGKAGCGEKTMVDAWGPALDAAQSACDAGADPAAVYEAAVAAAYEGALATEPMQATKGRASYLGERSIGHIDPGALSSALILKAGLDAMGEDR